MSVEHIEHDGVPSAERLGPSSSSDKPTCAASLFVRHVNERINEHDDEHVNEHANMMRIDGLKREL